jgi:hypothetical protein
VRDRAAQWPLAQAISDVIAVISWTPREPENTSEMTQSNRPIGDRLYFPYHWFISVNAETKQSRSPPDTANHCTNTPLLRSSCHCQYRAGGAQSLGTYSGHVAVSLIQAHRTCLGSSTKLNFIVSLSNTTTVRVPCPTVFLVKHIVLIIDGHSLRFDKTFRYQNIWVQ